MTPNELTQDVRNSFRKSSFESGFDLAGYTTVARYLSGFSFWIGQPPSAIRSLWEHQVAAISFATAYIHSDSKLSNEGGAPECALLKLPTGTGKSGVISVLGRCIPSIRRILVLTPTSAIIWVAKAVLGVRTRIHRVHVR